MRRNHKNHIGSPCRPVSAFSSLSKGADIPCTTSEYVRARAPLLVPGSGEFSDEDISKIIQQSGVLPNFTE